ncbi:glycosyl transferase [Romboutsia ilealis]|uniref:Glycosyl transferase n=1 Tax=Romboutsia faecis TaxID=2764597 RepID=A0ABR7JMJ0_9FIRM|nr:glycosyl transferase [Romboutsia faecis]MBC5996065.1 glycosyl transferase [Romboutsia faecis]MRN23265.1 glycosyl transferase [Romboutsia ilealis]
MNSYIFYAVISIIGFIGTCYAIPLFKNLLINSNVVRPNYKNDMIPVSMGIVFLPMIIINGIILAFFTAQYKNLLYVFMFIFGLISMFFAGILDDIIGTREVSGLKGHFKSFFKGVLTTGGFKAIFGGFVGLLISIAISESIPDIIINTLIIALSTNLMNLLDLRPGRAIKVYLVITVTIFITLTGYIKILPLLILPNVLAYFNYDLKAKAMMGDTGSNVLGISIGMLMVFGYSFNVRVSWLVFLVLIHILTEKYSLTKIIENNKILNFIDKLGR